MIDLKNIKYIILDMDGVVYHPRFLKTLFGQVSSRMTDFISLKDIEISNNQDKSPHVSIHKTLKDDLISFSNGIGKSILRATLSCQQCGTITISLQIVNGFVSRPDPWGIKKFEICVKPTNLKI